ncbi:MAG: cytochrome c family protein [Myxococcaceae bacterium]|nr:cytochrome c family protein [Myxococcaceae bacterium]
MSRARIGRSWTTTRGIAFLLCASSVLAACSGDSPERPAWVDAAAPDASSPAATEPDAATPLASRMSAEQLQDPAVCGSCHPKQYADWRGSMHAYSSSDPVFIAMNKRGQRETNGALGDFCIKCHAPMALNNKLTTDGLNLASLPKPVQGVTCYFCHNVADVGADHFNANLTLGNDNTMRGSIKSAVDPGVHGVAYAEHLDSRSMKASFMCGNCHDVVNPKGLAIERTLAEYRASISAIDSGNAGTESCQGCHMPWQETNYIAEVPSLTLKKRDLHDHRWAAVDVALTDFPDREAQRHATECALMGGAYVFELLNDGQGGFQISLETNAGHQQPSGTAQDRRLWLEVIAYDAMNNVLWQSGVIGDQEVEEYPLSSPKHDPQLCMFRDHFEDEAGNEVHMFWQAFKRRDLTSKALPIATEPMANHTATCRYTTPGRVQPARLTARLLMRPIGMDVLQSLVDSGDLDPVIKAAMPTFEVHNTVIEWTAEDGGSLYPIVSKPSPIDCDGPR